MRKSLAAFSVLLLLTATASASPVDDREALMKDIGRTMGILGGVMKGEKPFEEGTVQAALDALKADAIKLDAETLFPKGSEGGGASPKIWEDAAGFQQHIDKFRADTAKAADAKPQDVDALRVSMKDVGANCGACHQLYRVKNKYRHYARGAGQVMKRKLIAAGAVCIAAGAGIFWFLTTPAHVDRNALQALTPGDVKKVNKCFMPGAAHLAMRHPVLVVMPSWSYPVVTLCRQISALSSRRIFHHQSWSERLEPCGICRCYA